MGVKLGLSMGRIKAKSIRQHGAKEHSIQDKESNRTLERTT